MPSSEPMSLARGPGHAGPDRHLAVTTRGGAAVWAGRRAATGLGCRRDTRTIKSVRNGIFAGKPRLRLG